MHYGDLTATNLIRLIKEIQPDELYNPAAQSHVQVSFETPEYTANSDALGTLRLLDAIRILRLGARRASTNCRRRSFMARCRKRRSGSRRRSTRKLYAYRITVTARRMASFNHEGPMRARPSSPARSLAPPPPSMSGVKLRPMGWRPRIALREGIAAAYASLLQQDA